MSEADKSGGSSASPQQDETLVIQNAQTILPVGKTVTIGEKYFRDKGWVRSTIKVTKDKLICENENDEELISIPLLDIYYIDRILDLTAANSSTVLNFHYSTPEEDFVGLIKTTSNKKKKNLKREILKNTVEDLKCSYISPYKIGRKAYTNRRWNEGIFALTARKAIKILDYPSKNPVGEIPRDKLFRLETTKMKGKEALMIFYKKHRKIRVDLLSPDNVDPSVLATIFKILYFKRGGGRREEKLILKKEEKEFLDIIGDLEEKTDRRYQKMSDYKDEIENEHDEFVDKLFELVKKDALEAVDITFSLNHIGKKALEGDFEYEEEESMNEEDKDEEKSKDKREKEENRRRDLTEERRKKRNKIKRWVDNVKDNTST